MTAVPGLDFSAQAQVSPRRCPVCRGRHAKPLFTQQFEWIREGALIRGYDVVVCERCGCGYADRIPEQRAFDAYYRDLSKYESLPAEQTEPAEERGRYRKVAEVVLRALPSRANSILEVGCSTGGLLALLSEAGCRQVVGLDPSPECARIVRSLYGIEVLTGTIADLPAARRRFDFVILLGVLEHLREVADSLGKIREVLGPDARLLVDVPDVTRFPEFIDAPFQQFSIEHVNFFSPRSLANLLAQNGFEVLESGQDVHAHSGTSNMPSAYCIARAGSAPGRSAFVEDTQTLSALQEYIRLSAERERRLGLTIAALADSGEPLLVWGVGTLARRLLVSTRLREANIRAFVDSNPRYHGKEIHGLPILSPDEARARPETILICSSVFGREIEAQIRNELHCSNRVIRIDDGSEARAVAASKQLETG